jgi:intracellular sulfur oxidation DsrE/DsrF family protein
VNTFAQKQKHKIVFQLATDVVKEHGSLTRQLNNVLDYWPKAEIEVVVHSAALEFMMSEKTSVKPEIEALMERGVKFAVCKNTMKRKKVTESEIIEGAIFVPVGIAEIVLKQEKGYNYIKAGF